jgi:hypothetical protein
MSIRKSFRGERLVLCVGVFTSAVLMQVHTDSLEHAAPIASGAACDAQLWPQQGYGLRPAACRRADRSTDAQAHSRATPRATPRRRLWV